jgi:RNA polymerase sigma-70 factor, ECF subfamily
VNRNEVTQLLVAWGQGDREALASLIPLVDRELQRIAKWHMRQERPDHTLQTTALVNEAYIRLFESERIPWQNRAHFFAMAARLMRRILVDAARSRQYSKRGGGARHISIDDAEFISPGYDHDLLALDKALNKLKQLDPRKTTVVELKFFAGMDMNEMAAVLDVSPFTVKRDWRLAKAWLARELDGERNSEE